MEMIEAYMHSKQGGQLHRQTDACEKHNLTAAQAEQVLTMLVSDCV